MPAAVPSKEISGLLIWFVFGECPSIYWSLGGLRMVATLSGGCLLVAGGKDLKSFLCLLHPVMCALLQSLPKPLGCNTSCIKSGF